MDSALLRAAVTRSIEDRLLLEHPFYRRWEAGTLESSELAAYAEQYRFVERALPLVLAGIEAGLDEGPARQLVSANLADELGRPVAHTELFESFADAVGARPQTPATGATEALVATQLAAARVGPRAGLGVLAAYELQAADIAESKGVGLRARYGFDDRGSRFWDVHATMEAAHADWSIDALAAMVDTPAELAEVAEWATAGAEAWWAFLDDRQAAAPLGASC